MLKPFSLHSLSSLSLSLSHSDSQFLSLSLTIAPPSSFPLSHLSHSKLASVLGFGFWRLNRRVGFGSVGWDRLMVVLDWLIGGFESMDLLIGGWIGWVDHR